MNSKIIFLFLVFSLFFSGVKAIQPKDVFFNGDLSIKLEKSSLKAGDELKAKFTVFNSEPLPLIDAYLVVEIVQGDEYYYPSQFSDADNIFHEEIIKGINMLPNSSKVIDYSFTLPENLASGNYRIDVYLRTKKTPVVGLAHIFSSPRSVKFTVEGAGEFPQLKILRTKTRFHKESETLGYGPVGVLAEPQTEMQNDIFIENISSEKQSNLSLLLGVCEWDDTSCDAFISQKTYSIDSIAAGETKKVSTLLTAPAIPSAYAVRIELRDSQNNLVSLYRNRIIVRGGTSKIRKLLVNNYKFNVGEEIKLNLLLGPTPDHYTNPDFLDFKVRISVDDLREKETVFSETLDIGIIRASEFIEKEFSFTANKTLDLFEVCGVVEKNSVKFDEYCYVVDASLFPVKAIRSELKIDWSYDSENELLLVLFSNELEEAKDINATYYLMKGSLVLENGSLSGKSPIEKKFSLQKSNYKLVVNNLVTKKQRTAEINLLQENLKTCNELGGRVCSSNEICKKAVFSSDNSNCCLLCVSRVTTGTLPSKPQAEVEFPWLLVFIVIAVVVIAGVVYLRMKKASEELEELETEDGEFP